MNQRKLNQRGFTLVELIIVIILLSILAIVIIPKYFDLAMEAQVATTSAIAASLSSANSINYGTRNLDPTKGVAIANCTDITLALQPGLPVGYWINAAPIPVNTTVLCTLNGPKNTLAYFAATGIL